MIEMFEKIEKTIYDIKFKYTKLENYYEIEILEQDCFILLKHIHDSKTICDKQKNKLQILLFNTYDEIIDLWIYDNISKGDF